MSLDLKYRPKNFSRVLGNHGIVNILLTRSKNGSLSDRSMMFGGPKGLCKTSLARIVAKAIACPYIIEGEPCCECDSCTSIDDGSSILFEEFDAATQGTVDRIRSIVQDLDYGTMNGKPRVVILDEAHRLTKAAQDALLKPMEDRRVVIILCTTEPHNIKDTIRDRVEEYPVSPPESDDIFSRLKEICILERYIYTDQSLKLLIDLNKNNPRTSITSLETVSIIGEGVIDDSVIHQVFRFDSMKSIVQVLSLMDNDIVGSLNILDNLFSCESPTWIRDNIVMAISSSIRFAVGAKPTYPVPTTFFSIRGREWSKLGSLLSRIDRPDEASIQAILLESVNNIKISNPGVIIPPPINIDNTVIPNNTNNECSVSSKTTDEKPIKIVEEKEKQKTIVKSSVENKKQDDKKHDKPAIVEYDGVKFTKDECLTSLDSKISDSSVPVNIKNDSIVSVGLDKRLVPITPREFANGIIKQFK